MNKKILYAAIGAGVAFIIAIVVGLIIYYHDSGSGTYAPAINVPVAKQTPKYYKVGNCVYGTDFDEYSTYQYTENDLYDWSAYDLNIAINSIYARYGRRFIKAQFRDYFSTFDWYDPWRDEVYPSEFNSIENHNIALMRRLAKYRS